jgi:hypothetical protein
MQIPLREGYFDILHLELIPYRKVESTAFPGDLPGVIDPDSQPKVEGTLRVNMGETFSSIGFIEQGERGL